MHTHTHTHTCTHTHTHKQRYNYQCFSGSRENILEYCKRLTAGKLAVDNRLSARSVSVLEGMATDGMDNMSTAKDDNKAVL